MPEDEDEIRQGYAELVDDPAVTVWLAFLDGQPVGMQGYFPHEGSATDLLAPEGCVELTVAGTVPAARGLGIGRALTAQGLAGARAAGHTWCIADWRATNLLASRFWPQQGFRPVAYRLVRKVDGRVLWAN